jgi:hypothetical protein
MKSDKQKMLTSKAIVYKSELDFISRCVLDFPKMETGGDLFGFWTHSGYPVIQYASGPGPDAQHGHVTFFQDAQYLKTIGNVLRDDHGLQHIGQWHSHHQMSLTTPSDHDSWTVDRAISSSHIPGFLLIIANIDQQSTPIQGYMYTSASSPDYHHAPWVVLKGLSPIRKAVGTNYPHLTYTPLTARPSLANLWTTTLHEQVLKKPPFPGGYWLTSQHNQLLMKDIYENIVKKYSNVKLLMDDEDGTVFIRFENDSHLYRLSFPMGFPIIPPKLTHDSIPVYISISWQMSDGIADWIMQFLQDAFKNDKPNFLNSKMTTYDSSTFKDGDGSVE